MPVQRFEPMTKDYPTFDCDAHIVEPLRIWERAADHLTKDELQALKASMWYDTDTQQAIINGKADVTGHPPFPMVGPGTMDNVRLSGPGIKHDIQRALYVRNVRPETALTQEQSEYLAHAGAHQPAPRLRDMDIQGIDQVMIIPYQLRYLSLAARCAGCPSLVQGLQRLGPRILPRRPGTPLFRCLVAHAKFPVRCRGAVPRGGNGLQGRPDPPDGRHGKLPYSTQVRAPCGTHSKIRASCTECTLSPLTGCPSHRDTRSSTPAPS